jgi:hypothetical protein
MIGVKKINLFSVEFFLALALWSGFGSAAEAKSQYDVLVERVKNADPAVDFKELRIAYTKTPQYDPNKNDTRKLEMLKALSNNDNLKAIEYAKKVLADNYVNIRAHMTCATAYKMLGNEDKAKFHKHVFEGLISSIIYPGCGKSLETPFMVISVEEEYVILEVLELKLEKQELLTANGHHYDRLQVINPKTNMQLSLYFCVDILFNSDNAIFGK